MKIPSATTVLSAPPSPFESFLSAVCKPWPAREEGIDYAQLGWGLAITAGITIFGLAIGTDLFSGSRVQQAALQVHNAVVAAQQYRAVTGDYEDIDVEELVDNGFILPGFADDGAGENVYSKDLVITPQDSNANAQIEYETDSEEACNQLKLRVEDKKFLTTPAPSCGGTPDFKLTFKID